MLPDNNYIVTLGFTPSQSIKEKVAVELFAIQNESIPHLLYSRDSEFIVNEHLSYLGYIPITTTAKEKEIESFKNKLNIIDKHVPLGKLKQIILNVIDNQFYSINSLSFEDITQKAKNTLSLNGKLTFDDIINAYILSIKEQEELENYDITWQIIEAFVDFEYVAVDKTIESMIEELKPIKAKAATLLQRLNTTDVSTFITENLLSCPHDYSNKQLQQEIFNTAHGTFNFGDFEDIGLVLSEIVRSLIETLYIFKAISLEQKNELQAQYPKNELPISYKIKLYETVSAANPNFKKANQELLNLKMQSDIPPERIDGIINEKYIEYLEKQLTYGVNAKDQKYVNRIFEQLI